jgi:hypothetical protein
MTIFGNYYANLLINPHCVFTTYRFDMIVSAPTAFPFTVPLCPDHTYEVTLL